MLTLTSKMHNKKCEVRGAKCEVCGTCLRNFTRMSPETRFSFERRLEVGAYYYPRPLAILLAIFYCVLCIIIIMSKQFSFWCFTLNNYTDDDCNSVESLIPYCSFLVCGKEVSSTGTPHLQGAFYLQKKKTLKGVSRFLPRASLRVCKGDAFDNEAYARKENLWLRHGDPPRPGARTDIAAVSEMTTMRDIVMSATSFQAIRISQLQLQYTEPKRCWPPTVVWLYGSSGFGKTKSVYDAYGYDVVHKQDQFKWWQGYDGHEVVVLDDFRADFCKFHELLTLLDRYPYTVEQKGGSRQLRARKMFVTSCYSPWEVYKNRTSEDLKQLVRRLTYIVFVDEHGVFHFNMNPYRRGIFVA